MARNFVNHYSRAKLIAETHEAQSAKALSISATWRKSDTAKLLGINPAHVTSYLQLWECIKHLSESDCTNKSILDLKLLAQGQ